MVFPDYLVFANYSERIFGGAPLGRTEIHFFVKKTAHLYILCIYIQFTHLTLSRQSRDNTVEKCLGWHQRGKYLVNTW